MTESRAHESAERALMADVVDRLEEQVAELFGDRLQKVQTWPIETTNTHGWVRTIAQVSRGLWLRVWYDHYLGRDTTRYFSVWLDSGRTVVVEQRAQDLDLELHPRRTAKHRSADHVLTLPEDFLGHWFIDDWEEQGLYYVGRYSRRGTAAQGRDEIAKALLADVRTLLRGLPATSKSTQSRAKAKRFAEADPATLAVVYRRAGQGAFREAVLRAFGGRCVITGCDVPEVLEAAHIVPWSQTREQDASRALLLRADLHTLFDRGFWNLEQRGGKAIVVLADELKGAEPYEEHDAAPPAGARWLKPSHWAALAERQAIRER